MLNVTSVSAPQRKWLIGLGIFLLLGVIALLFFRSSGPSVIEKYKADLRAKGEKLTYEELVPSPQPDREQEREFLTAASGFQSAKIPPGSWDFFNFAAPGKVVLGWKNKNVPDEYAYLHSATTNSWEDFAAE